MSRPRPEVAEVVRCYGATYQATHRPAPAQRRILRDVACCRTAALGGHQTQCDHCGHEVISYNSCRNRHCPKCQAAARAQWLAARAQDLLPVPYFHVVFTLPATLAPLALQHKRVLYGLLFRAAAETLGTIARDPKHLGAHIGFLAVLHTWGQTLHHHPHLHCVVPGGGLAVTGGHWVPCRKHFLLPVRVLSRLFRRKYLAYLRDAREQGALGAHGQLKELADDRHWDRFLADLGARDWVVYAKPPFGGPTQVLKYLARYTHRVAISNQRLLSVEDGTVRFRWNDYAHGHRHRTMTLDAVEFLRRFLLHSLPKGFQRIRQYGFLANRVRHQKLSLCRALLDRTGEGVRRGGEAPGEQTTTAPSAAAAPDDSCPACRTGRMIVVAIVARDGLYRPDHLRAPPFDTS